MKQKKQKRKSKSSGIWLILAGVILVGGIAWYSLRTPIAEGPDPAQTPVAGVKTLPPDMFTGKAREAYQAAIDVPQVLNKVPCFCGCMDSPGHASNLFCFTDRHGVT